MPEDVAEIRIGAHVARLHHVHRFAVHTLDFERLGGAKIGCPGSRPLGAVEVFKRLAKRGREVAVVETPEAAHGRRHGNAMCRWAAKREGLVPADLAVSYLNRGYVKFPIFAVVIVEYPGALFHRLPSVQSGVCLTGVVNPVDVLFVQPLGEVDREDDPVPLALVDLNFRIIRFVSTAALTKAAVVAAPKHITIALTVHVQQRGPAVAATCEVDVVDDRVLIDLLAAAVWRDTVVHEIAKVRVRSHMADFHHCGAFAVYVRDAKITG